MYNNGAWGRTFSGVCLFFRTISLSLKLPSPALCNAMTSDQLQSRLTERHIVRTSVTYPALQLPLPGSLFFWPVCVQAIWFNNCGACCLVPYCVWLAADNNFVYVIALYFSKAFNTVRHVTLMDKMAAVLALPGDFFSSHSHCAKFADEVGYLLLYRHHGQCYTRFQSWSRIIHLLIPLTCAAQMYDLRPRHAANHIIRFADDTYLIIRILIIHAMMRSYMLSCGLPKQLPTKRLYCVEWHNTVFARSGPQSVHKLFTSCIRRCPVSRTATEWCQRYLPRYLF